MKSESSEITQLKIAGLYAHLYSFNYSIFLNQIKYLCIEYQWVLTLHLYFDIKVEYFGTIKDS